MSVTWIETGDYGVVIEDGQERLVRCPALPSEQRALIERAVRRVRRTYVYEGVEVECDITTNDEYPDTVCDNDDCPGLEIVAVHDEGTTDDEALWGRPCEIVRVAWDCRMGRAQGPTYGCGGQPAEPRFPDCPECGYGGAEL